jgi:amidase
MRASERNEIARLDATAQAELVRCGELSPAELVSSAIERIEAGDAALGAVAIPVFERALHAAAARRLQRGPFRGVPFLLKDLGARQADLPQYCGNRALRDADYRSPDDSPLGARFRQAGLVTLGVSKSPEFGLQSTTQPLAFGPTHNPWSHGLSAGGSSGGAAAAVAAGLVPIAHASDGAGSIRIPAAWCGAVGLKPSRGRVSRGPGDLEGTTTVEFAIARSVRDAAHLLDAVHGSAPGDLFVAAPPPARSFRRALDAKLPQLRIGVLTEMPGGLCERASAEAAADVARRLEAMGHAVEISWPKALFEQEERALLGLIFAPLEARGCLWELSLRLGRKVDESDVEPFLWRMAHLDVGPTPADQLVLAAERQLQWAARVASWWQEYDLLITPTVGVSAPPLRELDGVHVSPDELMERMGPHMAFTEPFNATGQPALALPCGLSPAGLPLSVQLIAAHGREDLLLGIGAHLEAELPRLPLPAPTPLESSPETGAA